MISEIRFSDEFQKAFLYIYDKSDMPSVSDQFLDQIILEVDKGLEMKENRGAIQ
jgi:hypothetical protein